MSHFKSGQPKFDHPGGIDIQGEDPKTGEVRVVKLEDGGAPQVKAFSFSELQIANKGDYAAVKAKYGSLAVTDEDRYAKSAKDNRFSINPLLRDPLAVEQEERRVIDARVREQVEAIREKAYAEGTERGFQEGLKRGHEEAFQKFREEGVERLQALEQLIQSFEGLKTEMFKANEKFLLEAIFRISKMVMLKELAADREYLVRLSRELLDRVGLRDNITIRVSPRDQESLAMLRDELPKAMGELKNLQFEVSDEIQLGGCSIETQWNAIDASIETQLNGIHDSFVPMEGLKQ
jgi:flagellar assembly protein FliH